MRSSITFLFCLCLFLFPGFNYSFAVECSVQIITSLRFGAYDPFSASDNESTGDLEVSCEGGSRGGTEVTVKLSTGNSGSYSSRQLKSGRVNALNYNIYRNQNWNKVWGDGTSNTWSWTPKVRKKPKDRTFYGKIPAGQMVTTGIYEDNITMTVEYN